MWGSHIKYKLKQKCCQQAAKSWGKGKETVKVDEMLKGTPAGVMPTSQ